MTNNTNEIQDPRNIGVEGLKGINVKQNKFANPDYKANHTYNPARHAGLMSTSSFDHPDYLPEDFGNSRFDKRITNEFQFEDLNELRAQEQGWLPQITSGLAKMGVYAATTFADGLVGTLAGVLNTALNIDKIIEGEDTVGNTFINNPVSRELLEINKWSEDVFKNYYTKEELEQPWYNNILSANFIGDKFIKNLGFMIGAAYSGKVTAGMMSKAMGLQKIRDAFKGTVVNSAGKKLETFSEIAEAYKKGDAFMNGAKLIDDLGKSAQKLKNTEWALKIGGSISAAMGEGRIQALSDIDEIADYNLALLQDDTKRKIDNIEDELFDSNPEYFYFEQIGDEASGNTQWIRRLKPEGIEIWNSKYQEALNKYKESEQKLKELNTSALNKDFLFNVALLSASDLIQFGRFMAGGYNTARPTIKGVTGGIKGTVDKEGKNIIESTLKSEYTSGNKIWRRFKNLSKPASEMVEEMSQDSHSETVGLQVGAKLNEFYGAKLNPEAEQDNINYFNSLINGFSNVYGNLDNWESGFIGFLTGMLGLPEFKKVTDSKTGKSKIKFGLTSEFIEGFKDLSVEEKAAENLVSSINKRIKDPEFLNYYQGLIRNNKYEIDKEEALILGDNFKFKNAEESQLLSDFIMFQKAGRLQDFTDLIDYASNITEKDIDKIKELTIDKTTGKSFFEGYTDEDIINHIHKQAEDVKKRVETYSKISKDLKVLYGDNLDDDYLSELTWLLATIDNREDRTTDLWHSIIDVFNNNNINISDLGITNIESLLKKVSDKDTDFIEEVNKIVSDNNIEVAEQRDKIGRLIEEKQKEKEEISIKLYEEEERVKSVIEDARRKSSDDKELKERIEKKIEKLESLKKLNPKQKASLKAYKQELKELNKSLSKDIPHEDNTSKYKNELDSITDVITKLLRELATLEYSIPLVSDSIYDKLIDISKLYATRAHFIDVYTAISTNPELYSSANKELRDSLLKDFTDKIVNEAIGKLDKVKTKEELLSILNDAKYKEYKKEIIEKAKNSDNEELLTLIKNYEEIEEASSILNDIIKELPLNPETLSAISIINSLLEESDSFADVLNKINEDRDEISKPIMDILDDIISKYREAKKSRKTSKKDTKGDSKKDKEEKKKKEEREEKKKEDDTDGGFLSELSGELEEDEVDDIIPTSEEEKPKSEKTLDEVLSEKTLDELKEIVNNESEDKDLRQLALEIYNSKVLPSASEPSTEDIPDKNTGPENITTQKFRSWTETQYDFNALKDRKKRKAVRRIGAIIDLYSSLGMYDFVDKGYLADMLDKDNDLPIHFIFAPNIQIGTIFLAVEIKEGDKKIHTITANDGKEYQIIGTFGYNKNNNNALKEFKEIADGIDEEFAKYINKGNDAKIPYVYSVKGKVTHIYSGRMVKSTEDTEVGYRDVSREFLRGTPFRLGIYYNKTNFKTPGLEDSEIVQLNENNDNPRDGSIWLMTKEADGRWYPKHIKPKRFNYSEYALSKYGDTPIIKRLKEDIKILINPSNNNVKRAKAKFDIMKILYIPKENSLVFKEDSTLISIKGVENNIINDLDVTSEEAINKVIDALMSANFRFNISVSDLLNKNYQDEILESGILETDLFYPTNVNASFDFDIVGKERGEQPLKGHTGITGVQESLHTTTVMLDNKRFSIEYNPDTYDWIFKDYNGDIIDKNSDRGDELLFIMNTISNPNYGLYKGSNDFYVGQYTSEQHLEGDKEFGIYKNRVIKGEELKKLKEKYDKKAEEEQRNEALNRLWEKGSEEELLKLLNEPDDTIQKPDDIQDSKSKQKEEDKSGLFVEGSLEELESLFGEEETTSNEVIQEETTPKVAKPESDKPKEQSTPTFTISEKFDATETKEKTENKLKDFVMSNRRIIKELGFKNYNEFESFVKDPKNKLPNIDSITTQEAFDSLCQTIKECR